MLYFYAIIKDYDEVLYSVYHWISANILCRRKY